MTTSYKSAGVNLKAAETSTKKIGELAKSTFTNKVLNDIGLFCGFYEIDTKHYPEPVIVTSIDGVGTKLKIAFAMNVHNTVGQDLVNHCVNDIMTSGATPIAFTDYIGTLDLKPKIITSIVNGMAKACRENQCALIGGETAEMPGFYSKGEYDLAGSIIGIINKNDIIDGRKIEDGDILIGLPSNGLHTNGYSLARKVLLEDNKIDLASKINGSEQTWGAVLLKIHKSYKKVIESIQFLPGLHGISHITGGGIEGNTKRLFHDNFKLSINWKAWDIPLEFSLIQSYGKISDSEMRKVFNLGIGMVFVVSKREHNNILEVLIRNKENPIIIGSVFK